MNTYLFYYLFYLIIYEYYEILTYFIKLQSITLRKILEMSKKKDTGDE